ncbi:acyltransferase family protein, partial [Bacillus toyonensis]
MPTQLKKNNRYMVGLDSLRGLAILGVVLYHVNYKWIPGGFLGVTVFFVLSGYLITDL